MSSSEKAEPVRLGFLAAIETRERAFVGGLLVTDRFGRPLEFQCTTPVKPNRTQELLYGPTLAPFIMGELLGKTLLDRVQMKPVLLFVDRSEMLPLRNIVSIPVLWALGKNAKEAADKESIDIGLNRCVFAPEHESDRDILKKHSGLFASDANLCEPLERVSEALKETMATMGSQARVA